MRNLLKRELQNNYIMTVLAIFVLNITYFSILLRIVEKDYNLISKVFEDEYYQKSSLDDYRNCFWFNFITMSSIGYGDILVRSAIG